MQTQDLTLTNFNQRKFTIHTYFLNENEKLPFKKRPLMIVIPGGSFEHLSKREAEPVALSYCGQGFHSVVVDYNLIHDEGDIYPDAALDILTVVAYFRKNADQYKIDPERIYTIGFSAGGHVASYANSMAINLIAADKYHYHVDTVRPNATILGYPLINIDKIGFPIPAEFEKYLPDSVQERDSALGVGPKTPPTLIFHAVNDPVVLIDNALEYITALTKSHVKYEAHFFEDGGHGFSLATKAVATSKEMINPHNAHWFNLSLEWLEKQK